ncbi:MAG: nuclear transport factor 2 family protein [Solirubrobacterales bacterium]
MPQSAETVIRRAYEAFAQRDVETLHALSAPDVRIGTVTGVLAQREEPYLGRDGIAEYLDDVGGVWDELDLEPAEFHELSDGGILVYGRVRARRGSMRVDAANAWQWRLEDGLITSVDVFGDLAGAAELLGG